MTGELGLDPWMFVGTIVVDQMNFELGREIGVEIFEKAQKLPVAVVRFAVRNHLAVEHVDAANRVVATAMATATATPTARATATQTATPTASPTSVEAIVSREIFNETLQTRSLLFHRQRLGAGIHSSIGLGTASY